MTGRLAAVWMVVGAFAALHYLCSPVRGSTFSGPGAGTAALLPRQVGDYRMRDTWLTKASGAMYEVGGLYSPWNAPKNEVEMFVLLNTPTPHDAIYCQLVRGEEISWRHLKQLKTADSTATFDIAIIQNGGGVRLVAATNCWSKGCDQGPSGGWGYFVPRASLISSMTGAESPVPLTVEIGEEDAEGRGETMQELMARLERFVSGLQSGAVYKIIKRAEHSGSEQAQELVGSATPQRHQ